MHETISTKDAMDMLGHYMAFAQEDCGYTALTSSLAKSLGFPEAVIQYMENQENGEKKPAKRRVILLGRHEAAGLPDDIEVVKQESVTWATDINGIDEQWYTIRHMATANNADILLQNVPGILAVFLARMSYEKGAKGSKSTLGTLRIGVIISVPGERTAGVEYHSNQFADEYGAHECARLVSAANGRVNPTVKNGIVSFSVDPVTPFIFSHIEWL